MHQVELTHQTGRHHVPTTTCVGRDSWRESEREEGREEGREGGRKGERKGEREEGRVREAYRV